MTVRVILDNVSRGIDTQVIMLRYSIHARITLDQELQERSTIIPEWNQDVLESIHLSENRTQLETIVIE